MIAKILSKKELEENFKELLMKNEYHKNKFIDCPNDDEITILFNSYHCISVTDMKTLGESQEISVIYYNNGSNNYFNKFFSFGDDSITPALSFDSIKEKNNYNVINEDEESFLIEYGSYPQTKIISRDVFNNLVVKFHTAELVETGEITFKIYEDGTKDKLKRYKDTTTGKEYAFVTEKEGKLCFSIEDMTADDLVRTNCTCGEILPIKWIVNKKTGLMIPLTGLMVSENYGDYRTSKLKEYLESGEFFVDIGVTSLEKKEEETTTMPWGKKEDKKNNSLCEEITRVLMGAHRIPYLVGHPGIGKTAIAKSINKNYLAYNISTFTPDRFTGKTALIPGKTKIITDENGVTYSEAIEPGTTSIALPDWYNEMCDMAKKCAAKSEKCVLFLDEFDKLTPNMQVFINGVVDTPRTIANLVIPDNVDIIFAGNTEEYSDASFNISGEVESRLTRIDVKADFQGWMAWAIKNNIDPLVRAYLLANKDDLVKDVTDSKGKYDYCKSLTPRSWDQKISEEIKISRITGEYPKLSLYMSSDMEHKFEEFMNSYFNLRVEDIINGSYGEVDTFAIDYSQFIEIAKNLAVVVSNEEQLENALKFIKKINNSEIQVVFEKLWIDYNNTDEDIIMLREVKENVFNESEVIRRG